MYEDYLNASEIAEYLYCQRAWWYRRQRLPNENVEALEEGTQQHEAFARHVSAVEREQRVGRGLLWLGIALLIVAVVLLVISRLA